LECFDTIKEKQPHKVIKFSILNMYLFSCFIYYTFRVYIQKYKLSIYRNDRVYSIILALTDYPLWLDFLSRFWALTNYWLIFSCWLFSCNQRTLINGMIVYMVWVGFDNIYILSIIHWLRYIYIYIYIYINLLIQISLDRYPLSSN
jgi:hypothetical protein